MFMNALRESAKSEDSTDLAAGELARLAMQMGLRRLAITIVRTEVSRNMLSDMAEMLTSSNSFRSRQQMVGKRRTPVARQSRLDPSLCRCVDHARRSRTG